MHVSEDTVLLIVEQTQGFSFAYLQELFLAAMMRWISAPERQSMDIVLHEQAALLRDQMHTMQATILPTPSPKDDEE